MSPAKSQPPSSIAGFRFGGVAAGIKKGHKLDLGAIVGDEAFPAAAIFTRNRVRAAPILLAEERLVRGRCRAVLANSGGANACTGAAGMEDAVATTAALAEAIGAPEDLVIPASTGVIGARLPRTRIEAAVPVLVTHLSPLGYESFADAILTTDRARKIAWSHGRLDGHRVGLLGIAKGAGMIAPNLATTLCFVVTDAAADPLFLRAALLSAADRTFNSLMVDGDTSTNDLIVVMASGRSGHRTLRGHDRDSTRFAELLCDVLDPLGRAIVRDGEGATKAVTVRVRGAVDEAAARRVARNIARSPLVKTALFGEDPNWGRVLAAAGAAGVPLDPDRLDVYFDRVHVVRAGVGLGSEAEDKARAVMKRPEYEIVVSLGRGRAEATCLTCDLTLDYVKINADYRS